MQMLSFTTDDGFSYIGSDSAVRIMNNLGGYYKTGEESFYYSTNDVSVESQLKLYARIDEILRVANKFMENIEL